MLNLHEAFEVREKSTIALVVFVAWGQYQIPDQILRQLFCTLNPLQKIEPLVATHLRIVGYSLEQPKLPGVLITQKQKHQRQCWQGEL
jgi:hypothetical protein